MNSEKIYYTPSRLVFLLHHYDSLRDGYLPNEHQLHSSIVNPSYNSRDPVTMDKNWQKAARLKADLDNALLSLPFKYRMIVMWLYICHWTPYDLCHFLNLSQDEVTKRGHTAILNMASYLLDKPL